MPERRRAALLLAAALVAANCSVVLVQGPPKPGEDDHDPTGRYPAGVPCTSSRTWPIVDTAMLLTVLAVTATYGEDQADDRLDGLLTAAGVALSAWIGYQRTNACRNLITELPRAHGR